MGGLRGKGGRKGRVDNLTPPGLWETRGGEGKKRTRKKKKRTRKKKKRGDPRGRKFFFYLLKQFAFP